MSSGYLWISSNNLDGIVKSINKSLQNNTAFSNLSGLSEGCHDVRILINSHVEVSLKGILGLSYQEEPNLLGNSISNIPKYEGEILVDTDSKISHNRVTAHLRWSLCWWLVTRWHTSRGSIGVLVHRGWMI